MNSFGSWGIPATRRRGRVETAASRKRARRQATLECLEDRTLLSYTFTGGGTNAGVATGDGNADTLYLEPFSGLIYHSTDGIVFSPDWGGGLTIAASTANSISVIQGNAANAHAVILGGVLGPASGLQAAIAINDGGPLDSLAIDDSADTQQAIGPDAYTVTFNSVTGPPTVNVSINGPALGAGLTLKGGTADNTFNVNSTFGGEPLSLVGNIGNDTFNVESTSSSVNIDGGAGANTFNLSPTAQNLSNLAGALVVNGTGGTNHVVLNDQNGAGGTYTVDGSTVSAPGFGGLTYGTIADLTLNSSNVGNTINVNGTSAITTLNTGTGADTVNVFASGNHTLNIHGQAGADTVTLGGSAAAPLGMQGLNGIINVDNAASVTTLILDDSQDTTGQTANLSNDGTTGTVTGLSPATINYTNNDIATLTVDGSNAGGNTFNVANTFANLSTVPTVTTINKGTGGYNTVNVSGTAAGSALDLTGGAGNGTDTVDLGAGGSVANILGPVNVNEVPGSTNLIINLTNDGKSHNFVLSSDGTTSTLHDNNGNVPDFTYTTSALAALTIDTDGAFNQTLNLNFGGGGNPIPTPGTMGLFFNAGNPAAGVSHALNISGELSSGPFASERHNANDETVFPQYGQYGSIAFLDQGGVSSSLYYAGLQPITDTAPATLYTFNDFADDQSFTATSPGNLIPNSIEFANTPTTPPPTFETTDIANKTNVVFNTPNIHPGAGLIGVVNIPTPSTGLTTLTFNTPTTGDNQVSFVNTPPGVVTSLNGGPEEDITTVTGLGVASGTTLLLNGGASTNTLNYDAGGLIPTVTAGALPGEVLISVPGAGTVDAVNYQTIHITNTAPLVITPGPAVTINSVEGFQLVHQTVATFTAPVGIAGIAGFPASAFTASLDWGDPSPDPSAGTITQDASNPSVYYVTGNHTFVDNGTYTVANTVAFAGGTITAPVNGVPISITFAPAGPTAGTSATATVTQGPLAVTAFPIVGTEGVSIAAGPIATFIDAGGADPIGDYSATINLVNSAGVTVVSVPAASITQNANAAQYTVNAPAFTLPEEGTYQVVVSVTDDNSPNPITVLGAATAVIADASLTPAAPVPQAGNTGVPLVGIAVGSFTDGNTAAPVGDFTGRIDWGDGSPNSVATFASAGGGVFNVAGTHTYAKPGVYTVTTSVVDKGGETTTLTSTFTITDLAVTGTVHNFQAVEGQNTGTIVLGTFEDPNTLATVANVQATLPVNGWGDGTPTGVVTLAVTQIGVDPANGQPIFQISGSHKYADEGTFTVNINVTTSGGVTTALTPGTATVVDAALSSSNGTEITGVEGIAPVTAPLLGTFTDANQGATVADFTTGTGSVVVNWGDGSVAQTLAAGNLTANGTPNGVVFSVNAPHTYAEAGTYAYTVTVTDLGGAVTIFSGSAIIADAPLTASATQPAVPPAGQTLYEARLFPVPVFAPPVFSGQVASFTDGNPTAPLSDFTATIDWGDGTPMTAGTISQPGGVGTAFVVSGAHTYADAGTGTYNIQVFVQDVEGARLTVTNTATVTDRPITLIGQLNPASDSGKYNNDGITNVAQPNFYGTSEPFSHVTLLANGVQVGQTQAGSDGSWSITSNHLADGSYAITATAVDQFGVTATTTPVTIVPNLVIDTVGPRVTYAAFDRFTATVTYTFQDVQQDGTTPGGSGLLVQSLSDAANYSLNRVHTRPPGTYIVTSINVTPGATPESEDVTVVFNNGHSLKGGYFQIIARAQSVLLRAGIQDVAGNALDGEFYGQPMASGNGVPGGNFVANIKSLHHAASPHGYSGPITIIGYPHPNDPIGKYPPTKSGSVHKKPAAPVKTAPVKVVPVKTAPVKTAPVKIKPVKVTVPKRTLPTSNSTKVKVSTPPATKTSHSLTMSQWNSIRSRMLSIVGKSQGRG